MRNYIYEEVWSNVIGVVLVCHCDTRSHHDSFALAFAVATCKDMTVVGYVPIEYRWISAICYAVLGKPGASITCSVASSRGCRNVLVVLLLFYYYYQVYQLGTGRLTQKP